MPTHEALIRFAVCSLEREIISVLSPSLVHRQKLKQRILTSVKLLRHSAEDAATGAATAPRLSPLSYTALRLV